MIQIRNIILTLTMPQFICFWLGMWWTRYPNHQPMITVIEAPCILVLIVVNISFSNPLDPFLAVIWMIIDLFSLIYLGAYHHNVIHRHKHDQHDNASLWKQAIKEPMLKYLEILLAILYGLFGLTAVGALMQDQAHYRSSIMSHDVGTFRVINSDNNNPANVDDDGEAPRGEVLDQVKINKYQIKGYNADHRLVMIYKISSYRYSEDHEGLIVHGHYQLAQDHVATKGKNTTDNHQYHFRPFRAGVLLGYKKGHAYISTQGTNDDKYDHDSGRYSNTYSYTNTPFGGNDSNESQYSYELEK